MSNALASKQGALNPLPAHRFKEYAFTNERPPEWLVRALERLNAYADARDATGLAKFDAWISTQGKTRETAILAWSRDYIRGQEING